MGWDSGLTHGERNVYVLQFWSGAASRKTDTFFCAVYTHTHAMALVHAVSLARAHSSTRSYVCACIIALVHAFSYVRSHTQAFIHTRSYLCTHNCNKTDTGIHTLPCSSTYALRHSFASMHSGMRSYIMARSHNHPFICPFTFTVKCMLPHTYSLIHVV